VARLLPFYFAADMKPDGWVLLGTVAVTLVMTAAFGMAPALKLSRTDLGTTLRRQIRNTRRRPARSALVVGQIAASVVLVAGAGLFVRSVLAARSVELGFDPENRILVSVQLGTHGYDAESVQLFQGGVLERIRALPGVVSAALTDRGPFSGRWTSTLRPVGTEYEEEELTLSMNRVGADYFETMGVQVIAGRPITELDDGDAVRSLVIGRTAAERLFPGESGVGRIFRWRDDEWTVVGVAEDAKYYSLGEEPVSRVYVPQAQVDDGNLTFVARTAVPPAGLISAIEGAIHEVDPAVAVFGVQTLQDLVDGQTNSYRSMAILVSAFGLVALILAAVGLYGVQAYLVGQRSKEIGIRIAMGARAGEVASSILGRGAVLSLAGVLIGVAIAFGLGRTVEGMLFGVEPQDPVTFVGVAALLLAVALAASYFPARRASRVDPMMVLKEE
jgi:predicted permease